jgi:putative membrane protein
VDTTRPLSRQSDRNFFIINALVSAIAVAFIAYILLREKSSGSWDLSAMPGVNATLNALAAVCLASGFVAIRRKAIQVHRIFMTSAFVLSALFLVGYLSYHFVHGDTKFTGTGAIRLVYFGILISHILLSLGIVPMALTSFYFAFTRSFQRHKRLNRVLLPIWMYVSVTGVVIFFMLRMGR